VALQPLQAAWYKWSVSCSCKRGGTLKYFRWTNKMASLHTTKY